MIAALENINITKAETSKLKGMTLENVPFGKYYTDHMLEADYENGQWTILRSNLTSLYY